jgi:hypothetical protein
MSDQHSFLTPDHLHPDPFTRSQTAERSLNAAIVQAEISRSFEEYLGIFDDFYAEDVEVSSETPEETISGKARVRSLLLNFLVPLHVMAEVGGLSVAIRESPIPGDAAGETYSSWRLDLVGASGKTCTLKWRTFRKWNGSSVVMERHYDQQLTGGPLAFDDLSFSAVDPVVGFQKPS